jgi:hypothetical protein
VNTAAFMKSNCIVTALLALAGCLSAASCNAQQSAYAYAILADNPVAYWPLNETNGPIIHDVIGGGSTAMPAFFLIL